ncbi:hypothetical protein Ancab_039223 [Ancistrocladus abbreviatus]
MTSSSQAWFCSFTLFLALCLQLWLAKAEDGHEMKSVVFLSPEFVMTPGSVVNRYYHDIEFPRGHIGLKSFNAEVVDENGVPVPLHEIYLHHWVVARYYQRKGAQVFKPSGSLERNHSDYIPARNSGICQNNVLGQYYGLGSETRRTATFVPDPYAIEIGNPAEIPVGYEEKWFLNVHAIDTRGVVNKLGCTECRCDLYNVTEDEYGRPLKPGYEGGLRCCYDKTQCQVKKGFASMPRSLYLRYTVKWIDWDSSILPVKIFIFDVTDGPARSLDAEKFNTSHNCRVEYEVNSCKSSTGPDDGCIDSKRMSFVMPKGGYVIYGVAHQHSGGIGSALYREDGRVLCSSIPTYGEGKEAGNEAGYIVGMSTCYPQPGTLKLSEGETLILESNYSSAQKHTGVMGLFYILVADQVHMPEIGSRDVFVPLWAVFVLAVAIVAAVVYRQKSEGKDHYQPILG